MNESLARETERLARSWLQHEAAWLDSYLVAGVEDPRLNVQSVLSRQFLIRALTGDRFGALMDEELRFAATMGWLTALSRRPTHQEELGVVFHALKHGSDNAEGIEVPRFVLQAFAALPVRVGDLDVPNYIEHFLSGVSGGRSAPGGSEASGDTFQRLWRATLASAWAEKPRATEQGLVSVVEPACGSANDYRYLEAYGLGPRLDYTGVDLCATNIQNARARFPNARFRVGNVFELSWPDKAFDYCVVQDLFEHLSLEGLHAAVQEVCRVTRLGICAGFFQMDEIPEHVVRPVDEYHWNLLSVGRIKELFGSGGFSSQVVHIDTFLRERAGCLQTHNPSAYTVFAKPTSGIAAAFAARPSRSKPTGPPSPTR